MRGMGERSLLLSDYLLKGMKWMGYSAVNVSARDLNNGGDYIKETQKKLNLDFVSANIVYKESGKPFAKPYVIETIKAFSKNKKLPFKKLRVGMVGLTDAGTQLFSSRIEEPMLESLDPVPVAASVVPEMRKKADLIILLYYGRFQNLLNVLEQAPDIDIVVLGQEYYRTASYREKKPVIVGVSSMGKYCGILSIDLDENLNIVDHKKENIALSKDIQDDPMFAELVKEYKAAERELNTRNAARYKAQRRQNAATPPGPVQKAAGRPKSADNSGQ